QQKIRELEKQAGSMQAILENMAEGVIALDAQTRITSFNPAAEKIFVLQKKEAEGRFFLEAIRNNSIAEVISKVLADKNAVSQEIELVWPLQKIFQVNVSPLFENAAVNGCLLVIHDITELRKLERIRRDFVANVSHELKTPLTSIKGFVETLLEGALDDKAHNRDFLQIIQRHSERLNSLVDDLLSLSHLESKEIILNQKSFNLRQQLEEIIAGFKAQLKKRNIGIKNELPTGISLSADQDKIGQVFTNLIDNAIKFNQENGFIRIYAEKINGGVKIMVEDSGIGIPEREIPRIFERFYRVDKARSRELGGTGLGLSIVKHIIDLHQGSVGVESVEGLGSKFWFILPG
ncbi:MAG: ATP-binding protein, partial [Candidatus Omnitrophota bacterium]|nr:ATP-binding protein [Candidatus Omnitrophota bacterium]